ncbi:Copper type 2 ascorbate-dependent monooxygenase [Gracilaria domingensis]|nr:Copper type 2 ascorbate-dependent monooxygenase [Gracilaria domingensis]
MIVHLFLSGFLIFSLLYADNRANALKLSQDYEFGPISLSEDAELFYTVDLESSTASFAVVVNDTEIVSNSSNWIGFGISEPTSGSMLGADVVTAEFSSGQTIECELTDRYVPFYAFPLIKSIADAPSAFPLPDDCQNDDSWTLISCMRSTEDGQLILEVSRSLDAHDAQDREIPPGPNSVIYAYGSAFAYHGSRRSSTRVILYEEDGTPDAGMDEKPLPEDVDGSIDVTATGWTVPSDKVTTYACTSKVIRLSPGEQRMIVAAEPILNATDDAMVHHLTFWLCRSEEYAELTRSTVECSTGGSEIPGPQGSNFAQCATFIYAYVKGMKRLVLPEEAGILMDDENYILILETHYDNPDLRPNTFDSSGVRVYYTNTMRHPWRMGLNMNTLVRLLAQISSVGQSITLRASCTCTQLGWKYTTTSSAKMAPLSRT